MQANGTEGHDTNERQNDYIFNNQFTDDGRRLMDILETYDLEDVADDNLKNNLKTFWYLSIDPLPDVIANNPRV